MTLLSVKAFNGLKPVIKPRLLPDGNAQVAQNVRLISGSIEPLRGTTTLKATTVANPKTIYRFGSSGAESQNWLEFANDTDLMRSPVPNDQFDRLYWADGITAPRYAANGNVGSSYQLGIPAPSASPALSAFGAVTEYTTVTREYVLTFYNPTATKESLPGAVLSVQAVNGQKVAFSKLTTDNLGDAGITKKRIYRKVSGTYRLVTELDLAVTTYDDSATDAALSSAASLSVAIASAPTAPTRAPTASAGAAIATAAAITRDYVYTVRNFSVTTGGGENEVTTYYEESAASPVRSTSADATQTITIGDLSNALNGTHFRLYRRDAGGSAYQLVAEVPATQSSISDVIGRTVLGISLASTAPANVGPASAPTAAISSSTASSVVSRVYMITYLDASGNESNKSPISNVVSVVDGVTAVAISHSETLPVGVSKKRLYRQTVTVSGGALSTSDANWKLVTEVTASATSTTDSATEASLGGTLSSNLRNLPPSPTGTPTINATIPAKQVPESRTYVLTYVSAYGEEGPPSTASAVTALDPAADATLTLASAPGGNYNLTLKRLYRSSTVGGAAQFQLVPVTWAGNSTPSFDIPIAVTSVTDSADQAELAEVLPSEGWEAPPATLKGLRMVANGAAVGFSGRTVYLSEPNLPHAWPHKYPIDYDIVGVAVFGQTVAVLTDGYPFLLQGADPAAMTPTKLEVPQACASKRSIVETGDGVIYASPDGLVSLGAVISVITEGIFSRDQWQAFVPSSMECYLYNRRIHVFYTAAGNARGCLVFDLTGQGAALTTIDMAVGAAVTAGYYSAKTDLLYLAQGGNIVRFDQGSALTLTWRSKLFRLAHPQNMRVGQVRAATYPVTLKIYADGALKHTQTVADNDHFVLPSGFRGIDWEFQVEASTEVSEVSLATSIGELQSV
jgi:hypothetical protein